jgi:RNA polymerase sigma factor (sigma-70 family)
MIEQDGLAVQFQVARDHLRSVAYRLLGDHNEADDAVQEAWLRLTRSGTREVQNLTGWLTTVVARVCLDMLRARASRREDSLTDDGSDYVDDNVDGAVEAADSIGLALFLILEMLSPAERVAFVLHDVFDVPFEDIAPIVSRTPMAARQLASRARRRVRGAPQPSAIDPNEHKEIVSAFLAASRNGDLETLIALLDPAVMLRADNAALQIGATAPVHGAHGVAKTFAGRAKGAQLALINEAAGLIWAQRGQPRVLFGFSIVNGKIVDIEMTADTERISRLKIVL